MSSLNPQQLPLLQEKVNTNPSRWYAFKVSLCGAFKERDFVTGLTLAQATAYPTATQVDDRGSFFWLFSADATKLPALTP